MVAQAPVEPTSKWQMMQATVDIVIPVYNACEDLQLCVDSVRRHTRGGHRLVLIDDASPDPRIAAYFAQLAAERDPHLMLLANERNRGFVGTVNRGMSLSDANDVVLLNSDTIVTPGWLEKIVRCAASDPKIGTITPFSNNAEICSFPRFCENNPLDGLPDIDLIAQVLAQTVQPRYPELPTAVGFCMFIRRTLLERIGTFDAAEFGLGYGEENDFCMRARKAGFRNVLCDDAFVAHTGSRSFDSKKAALVEANTVKLLKRHPEYPELVRSFIEADTLRATRSVVSTHLRIAASDVPGILHVLHGAKGGTENHVRDLVRAERSRFRHYLLIATEDRWRLEDGDGDAENAVIYEFARREDEPWADLLNALCETFRIDLCHVHHISSARGGLLHAIEGLARPYGVTLHDFYFACPTTTMLGAQGEYCGAITDAAACQGCLGAQSAYQGISIAGWRETHGRLLAGAQFVIAPSAWLAGTLRRYFPDIDIRVVPHGIERPSEEKQGMCSALLLPRDGKEHVGVIGAIGPVKGARRLERLVARTRERKLPLRWVLVGYLDTQYLPHQDRDQCLTVHGAYKPEQLGALLEHYGIRLAVFPSAGPESFSYTLSEAWSHGRPALVPPIGALGERVQQTGAGWLMDDWQDEDRILDQIVAICSPGNAGDFERRRAAVQALDIATLDAMSAATEALYAQVIGQAPASRCAGAGVSRQRLYQAAADSRHASDTNGAGGRMDRVIRHVVHRGLRIRYTPVGKWLYKAYKATPSTWQQALRRRVLPH